MNHTRLITIISSLLLACSLPDQLRAADGDAVKQGVAPDEATQKKIDAKTGRLLGALKLEDAAKAARVKSISGEWFVALWNWHKENDPKLNEIWSQWGKARAVVPKDDFPAEVIAFRIDDFYAPLKPAYKSFTEKLAAELSQEQIDTIKETWSRSPGMTRTYNAYLEIVPDLNDEQKKVIHDRMLQAREAAMLTDADKEIINIYKRHKVKVEEYVGTLEWTKLHSAFANRGKPPTLKAPTTN
jgi:hypothetical protein